MKLIKMLFDMMFSRPMPANPPKHVAPPQLQQAPDTYWDYRGDF